jgi:hypothetical protein
MPFLVPIPIVIMFFLGIKTGFFSILIPMAWLSFVAHWNLGYYDLQEKRLRVFRGRTPEYIDYNRIQKLERFSNTGLIAFLFGNEGIRIHFGTMSVVKIYPNSLDEFETELRKASIKAKSKND